MSEYIRTIKKIQDSPIWAKTGRNLLSFDIEITARCNNDCRHCYICLPARDKSAREQELSIDEISRIADDAVTLGAIWVLITGGEPLLRDDFSDIYLLLKRKGLIVSVFTNGTCIKQEHAEMFKEYPPGDIEVSVYGATEKTYERVTRRRGSYRAFQEGLQLLLDNGLHVRLKAMALRSNYHEIAEIAKFCRSCTKDYFRFDPLLHLRFDGNAARNKTIISERLTPQEIVLLEQEDTERFSALLKHCDGLINERSFPNGCDHLFHCGAGAHSFSVSYNGTFRLCPSLWAPGTTYDLRTGSLREAWEQVVPRVQDLRSQNQEFLNACRRCPIINLCLWCPAHAYLESGSLDTRIDYFCEVAHTRAAALGYLRQIRQNKLV